MRHNFEPQEEASHCECGGRPVRLANQLIVCACSPPDSRCLTCLWEGRVETFESPYSLWKLAAAVVMRAMDDAIGNFSFSRSKVPKHRVKYERSMIALEAQLWLCSPSKERELWFSILSLTPPTPFSLIPILLGWRELNTQLNIPKKEQVRGCRMEVVDGADSVLANAQHIIDGTLRNTGGFLEDDVYGESTLQTGKSRPPRGTSGTSLDRKQQLKADPGKRTRGIRARRETREVPLNPDSPFWSKRKRKRVIKKQVVVYEPVVVKENEPESIRLRK